MSRSAQILYCKSRFADHCAPRALDEPEIAFFGARYGLRSRDSGWLRHAGQQGLRQSVKVGEQRLLSPRNAEYVLSHLVCYAFLRSRQTLLPLGQFLLNGVSDERCRGRKPARPRNGIDFLRYSL
jgi:hypothetical protein